MKHEYTLKIDNLHKSFFSSGEKISVVRGAHLEVKTGESVSIRGESGAGKTTLLYLMTCLETADHGTILWDGEDVATKSNAWLTHKRASFIGFVFQSYYLIPELSAVDNILIARRFLGPIRACDIDRAHDLIKRIGVDHREKQPVTTLSGGEQQRVAIARALMNQPPLIIADEPTGNLDEKTGNNVMEIFLNLCQEENRSLILVTHNPDFAQKTQRQCVMQKGLIESYAPELN